VQRGAGGLVELGEALVGGQGGEGVVSDLVADAQGSFEGDAQEPEGLVREDLDPVALGEVAVEADDLGDLVKCSPAVSLDSSENRRISSS